MTDEQIIPINIEKYAEALNNLIGVDSAYFSGDKDVDALIEIITVAKKMESIINRQKAEIERLAEEVEIKSQKRANIFEISSAYERGKAEAITQYCDEVKKRCVKGGIFPAFVNRQMEDVKKEMVGE